MEGKMLLKLWAMKESFVRSEKGATAIEYGLIAAGIAVAIAAVVFTFGTELREMFQEAEDKISARESMD
ncbi:MAG: Flp family type IVb pilin [Alphaproteobacteria bacterium]|jgi:pilus assembly protein Flp/PilA